MVLNADSTKLEAINEILLACAQRPIATLGEHLTARQAELLLTQADRRLQTEGWYFNTETDITLQVASDEIPLAINVISVDSADASQQYVKRGSRLYNIGEGTYTFTGDVSNLIVRYRLEWTELPQSARDYLTARVARQLHAVLVGDVATQETLRADEVTARAELMLEDAEQSDKTAAPSRYDFREEGAIRY